MNVAKRPAGEQLRQNELKWGKKLMRAGFTVVPSVILDRQDALGLDAVDVNIILHLACRWWYVDNPPFPSKKSIARAMGIHPRTVQRRIAALENQGFIEREKRFGADRRQESNRYILKKLIEAATPFAEEEIQNREKEREARANRKGRKKPRLHVVPGVK